MHLLSCHWNRQHHSYLITYRPAFMRDMACNGPYFSKLLLNAIYFSASKFTSRVETRSESTDVHSSGSAYRQRVKELLVSALEKSTVTTIQALLLMTRSLFALGEEKSTAWMYAGIAFRMMVDLGMHIEGTSSITSGHLTDEDLEIRRRVFWAAFGMSSLGISLTAKRADHRWQWSIKSNLFTRDGQWIFNGTTAVCRLVSSIGMRRENCGSLLTARDLVTTLRHLRTAFLPSQASANFVSS